MCKRNNIILIGMPGSGKSTVGVILAKISSKSFIDTDLLIQSREQRTLQDIVDNEGHMQLRELEEQALLSLSCTNHVIATGGSAAYSEKAMLYLKRDGLVVYLAASLDTLRKRIHNFDTRGLAKRPDQSLEDLYQERISLYKKYADITVQSSGLSQEEVSWKIIKSLE